MFSQNKKYIGVIVNKSIVGNMMVHSDIVEFGSDYDHFIMHANRRQTKDHKYEYLNNTKKNYGVYFTDLYNN